MKTDERNKTANVAHLQKIRDMFLDVRVRRPPAPYASLRTFLPLSLSLPILSLFLLYNIISIHR